jgi:hypothetical protein
MRGSFALLEDEGRVQFLTYFVESIDSHSNSWCILPAILNTFCVPIEEFLQLVVDLILVNVVPFLGCVNTKPTLY